MENSKDKSIFKKPRVRADFRINQDMKNSIRTLVSLGVSKNITATMDMLLELGLAQCLKTLDPAKKAEYKTSLAKSNDVVFPLTEEGDLDIDKISFSSRTAMMLKLNGISKLSDFVSKTEKEIEGYYGLGAKGLEQIKVVLEHYDIQLKQ